MALGFGFGGIAIPAALLHLIYHSLMKPTLFFLTGNILLKFNSAKIRNVRGALTVLPITSVLLLTSFLAITGTPPFGTFLTKVHIFTAGFSAHPIIVITALFFSALLFIGFFKQITIMIFGEKPSEMEASKENKWLNALPALLLLLTLVLSLYIPPFIHNLISSVALHTL
jgi:hydrogenase-4 component F